MPLKTSDLRCPLTREKIRYVGRSALEGVATVPPSADGAYVSDAAQLVYPVIDGIPNFLVSQARALRDNDLRRDTTTDPQVREWYENFGWQRNSDGQFRDSELFAGATPPALLYEQLSHLAMVDALGGGDLLLDAGCGPLPHPEHLEYQRAFGHRICVDFSLLALQNARAKLGESASYFLADLRQLPLRSDLVDGVISAYTIMHVDESAKSSVVEELLRVVRPTRPVVFITDNATPNRRLQRIYRDCWRPFAGPRKGEKRSQEDRWKRQVDAPRLYFQPPSYSWWYEQARRLDISARVHSLRVFHVQEFERYFGDAPRAPHRFRRIERIFPRLLAPMSRYLKVELRKPVV